MYRQLGETNLKSKSESKSGRPCSTSIEESYSTLNNPSSRATTFFINSLKGGTGKTTFVLNFASAFTRVQKGAKVVIIDLDGQCNCSSYFDEVSELQFDTEMRQIRGICHPTDKVDVQLTNALGGMVSQEDFGNRVPEDLLHENVSFAKSSSYFPSIEGQYSRKNMLQELLEGTTNRSFAKNIDKILENKKGLVKVNEDFFGDTFWVMRGSFLASLVNIANNIQTDLVVGKLNHILEYGIFNRIIKWLEGEGFHYIFFDTNPYPSDVNKAAYMSSDYAIITAEPKLTSLQGLKTMVGECFDEEMKFTAKMAWAAQRKKIIEVQQKSINNDDGDNDDEFIQLFYFKEEPPKCLPIIFNNYHCNKRVNFTTMMKVDSNVVRTTADFLKDVFFLHSEMRSDYESIFTLDTSSKSNHRRRTFQTWDDNTSVLRFLHHMKLFAHCEQVGRTVFDFDVADAEVIYKYEREAVEQEQQEAKKRFQCLAKVIIDKLCNK